jgi:hypothetical protein
MKTYWRSGGIDPRILDLGGEGSASRPGRFTPKERAPGIHCIGGWVGPRAVLDTVVKRKIPSARRESNPRTTIAETNVHDLFEFEHPSLRTSTETDGYVISAPWSVSFRFVIARLII